MVYQLHAQTEEPEELEFCTTASPARLQKLLRLRRAIKNGMNGLCLAACWACIGVSLVVFGYILLG